MVLYIPIEFANARHQSNCDGANAHENRNKPHINLNLVTLFVAFFAVAAAVLAAVTVVSTVILIPCYVVKRAVFEVVACRMSVI